MRVILSSALFLLLCFPAQGQQKGPAGTNPVYEDADDDDDKGGHSHVDPASDPPKQPVELKTKPLNTRISGQAKSELFLSQRHRMQSIGGGRYAVRSDNVYPFYETLRLRVDEIGHRGLSLHFEGWAGLDLAQVHFDQRFVADPTYLYLQFKDYGINLKLGRQAVYSGAARGLTIDGGYVAYQAPFHLGVEGYGGMVVSPYRGPDWYRDRPQSVDYDDFTEGLSDWDREGDYAVGGRVFYRVAGRFSAGVSILHMTELEEVDQQVLAVDLDMTPHELFGVSGNASLDIFTTELRDAQLALDVYPLDVLRISCDYRHVDPTLYLSHMSIFSVFSIQEHDTVGGTVGVTPHERLGFFGGYHHHFYSALEEEESGGSYEPQMETGHEIEAGASGTLGQKRDATVRLSYRRIFEGEQGIHGFRLGGSTPLFVPRLKAAANLYADLYDEDVNGRGFGLFADTGLYFGSWLYDLGGSVSAGTTPFASAEVRGMIRFNLRFDLAFVKEVRP